jgi:hypothetical protein
MSWELVERVENEHFWSVTERLPLGAGYLVRSVWRARVGGERLDGSALVMTGAFDLPAPVLAIAGPMNSEVA